MNIEVLVSSDLREHASATARRLRTPAQTEQALTTALAQRRSRAARRPVRGAALGVGVAALAISAYAVARAKLFHVDVDVRNKTDTQAEAEIKKQIDEQGWRTEDVRVERSAGTTEVEVGATDEDGRHIHLKHLDEGPGQDRIQLRPESIDDTREPGMSDAQLREKILAQLRARSLEGDVTVDGERVRIQIRRGRPE